MSYKSLISNLKSLLETIDRYDTDVTAGKAMLKTAWTAGRDVYAYTRETGESIKTIAFDAGAAKGSLEKYVRFYKLYPDGYKDEIDGHALNLSHYTALLYVGDRKIREFYLKEAALQDWSSHELRRRIRNNYYENRMASGDSVTRCPGDLKKINQKLYTYAAKVIDVVDADTLWLEIDVGFCTKMEHKVRLRGINCPEKGTKKGDEAKAFVEEQLQVKGRPFGAPLVRGMKPRTSTASNHGLKPVASDAVTESASEPVKATGQLATRQPANSIVIIRSYKSEKFGRYLVDLWYLKGETDKERILAEGQLLNQVLLVKGLAFKVE